MNNLATDRTIKLGSWSKMIERIVCDKCNIPVETMTCNFYQTDDGGYYHFTVRCHGEFERAKFPTSFLEDGWRIVEARAFRQPKIKQLTFKPGASDTKTGGEQEDTVIPFQPDDFGELVSSPVIWLPEMDVITE